MQPKIDGMAQNRTRRRGRPTLGTNEAQGRGKSPTRVVSLTPELDHALKQRAEQAGEPMGRIIRAALAKELGMDIPNRKDDDR